MSGAWSSVSKITLATALVACGGRTGLDFPEPPCPALSADCDHDPTNGCEADLGADADNCGACGVACAAGLSCADRVCVPGDTLVQLELWRQIRYLRNQCSHDRLGAEFVKRWEADRWKLAVRGKAGNDDAKRYSDEVDRILGVKPAH